MILEGTPSPEVRDVQFFNKVAHSKGFHPLLNPNNWYHITERDIVAFEVYLGYFLCRFQQI